MDNLTHTLIGFTLAKSFTYRSTNETTPAFNPRYQSAAQWVAILGSNLPDLDILLYPIFEDKRLGYLVHHRGYTHTLWAALLSGALLAAILIRIFRISEHRLRLYLLGVLSIALHIGFDFLNNYGTHPFSPISNRWFYGDTLFIVEPTLWFWLLPFVLQDVKNKIVQSGALLALGGMTLLTASLKFTHFTTALFCFLFLAASFLLNRNKNQTPFRVAGLALIVSIFGMSSLLAKTLIQEHLGTPRAQVLQTSAMPLPANPLCWGFLRSQITVGPPNQAAPKTNPDTYEVFSGTVALVPEIFSVEACSQKAFNRGTSLFVPPVNASPNSPTGNTLTHATTSAQPSLEGSETPGFRVSGVFRRSLQDLATLNPYCRLHQLLKFSRFPYWFTDANHSSAGDLRFADTNGGFGHVELESSAPCQELYAPWDPPSGLISVLGEH